MVRHLISKRTELSTLMQICLYCNIVFQFLESRKNVRTVGQCPNDSPNEKWIAQVKTFIESTWRSKYYFYYEAVIVSLWLLGYLHQLSPDHLREVWVWTHLLGPERQCGNYLFSDVVLWASAHCCAPQDQCVPRPHETTRAHPCQACCMLHIQAWWLHTSHYRAPTGIFSVPL